MLIYTWLLKQNYSAYKHEVTIIKTVSKKYSNFSNKVQNIFIQLNIIPDLFTEKQHNTLQPHTHSRLKIIDFTIRLLLSLNL